MIAIVTGATGDIGEEFVKSLLSETDQVWAVGRSENKLTSLKEKYGDKIVPVRVDLSDRDDIFSFCRKIESGKPEIKYLVNNAGVAKMKPVSDFTLEEISDMLDINDKAATLICRACIPYMVKGSYILNVASASAFQPNPYIALYSASKAYLLSFTRSLNVENENITCTAVCPGWVDTQMLPKQRDGKDIRYPGMTPASKVVDVALKDCHKGKDVSVCSFYFRYMRFLSKVTPHSIAMKMWVKVIRQYI
ncbi:MAG: SDR family NAD(P)-dependent oxidoreductase [Ruminococcaceae bacterium]|nr:SDR family NAD(P)-dependent oxidoreductase [Oscillospiraceae bacterium]